MIKVCSYCKKFMGEKAPLENTNETHCVCDTCYEKVMSEMEDDDEKKEEAGCAKTRQTG